MGINPDQNFFDDDDVIDFQNCVLRDWKMKLGENNFQQDTIYISWERMRKPQRKMVKYPARKSKRVNDKI